MCLTPSQKSSWSCKYKTRLQNVARNITAASLEFPLGNLVVLGTDTHTAVGNSGGMVESSRFATLRIGGVEWSTTKPWIRHQIQVRILCCSRLHVPKKSYSMYMHIPTLHKHGDPIAASLFHPSFLCANGANRDSEVRIGRPIPTSERTSPARQKHQL